MKRNGNGRSGTFSKFMSLQNRPGGSPQIYAAQSARSGFVTGRGAGAACGARGTAGVQVSGARRPPATSFRGWGGRAGVVAGANLAESGARKGGHEPPAPLAFRLSFSALFRRAGAPRSAAYPAREGPQATASCCSRAL